MTREIRSENYRSPKKILIRISRWLAALAAVVALNLPGIAEAGNGSPIPSLDQSFISPGNLGADINEGFRFVAQTFTAGATGTLGGVNIEVGSSSILPLHVAIRTVIGGVPSSTVLGETALSSSSAPLSRFISFPQVISIAAGVQYAIVVNYEGAPPPGAGQSQGIWGGAVGDRYAGGALCLSALDGISWNCGSGDVHFQTYVDLAPAGFNVNSLVTFAPIASTYRTVTNTAGCPAGFVGKFTFTARLTNKSSSPAMPGLDVIVQTLTNGNVLLDSQTKVILGGAGADMEIPRVGQYGDGLLSSSEAVDVPFIICLKTRQSFQFFVDVFGIVTKLVSINRAGTDSGNDISGISGNSLSPPELSADSRFVLFGSEASDLVVTDTNGTNDAFVRDLTTGATKLVSVNRAGTDSGNGISFPDGLSADGRFVGFSSLASDLVATDTNGTWDAFVRDLTTGATTLVSVNRAGTNSGNNQSFASANSADGRFAVFTSRASDLVATDTNGQTDVFVRDLKLGTTTLASVNRAGTDSGNGISIGTLISADGRFVLFYSNASDLVATPNTNRTSNTFVRDLKLGTTTLVSVNWTGTDSGNEDTVPTGISADGRLVAFGSAASDLVATDTNGQTDVFVRDLKLGTTTLVSVNRTGTGSGNVGSDFVVLSADGRFVGFSSGASDLVTTETNGRTNVFVRDLQTGSTSLVSINQAGTAGGNGNSTMGSISADGRFVAFISSASNLVATDTHGRTNVFVRDLQMGTTTLMSVNPAGTEGGDILSVNPGLSADGRFATFLSFSSNLVPTDTNGQMDVFIRPVPW